MVRKRDYAAVELMFDALERVVAALAVLRDDALNVFESRRLVAEASDRLDKAWHKLGDE